MRATLLIPAFAISSALLYCGLLPLWEGFDEAFHYAYVQSLSVERRLPVLGQTSISAEVGRSLELAPVSHVLHRVFPGTTTFDQWFALPGAERTARRQALAAIPPELQRQPDARRNYEAHQPPLAYALLAPVDALASGMPLLQRVLLNRACAAVLSGMSLLLASLLLCRALGLEGAFRQAALACIFTTQMLWATVAHVANDWLALPVATAMLALLVMAARFSRGRDALWLGVTLAAGLLTKAYFLAFVPVVAGLLWWKARRGSLRPRIAAAALLACVLIAGPWYARNWMLHGNLSGTQEAFEGIGPAAALSAVPRIAWPQTIAYMARASLWTGNNSFTTFSRVTLNIELAGIAAAFALYILRARRMQPGEGWLLAAIASFCLALAYATCTIWVHTKGTSAGASSPWYSEVLLAPVMALAFLGLQRAGAAGRVVAAALVLVSAWISAATYVAKLLPLYAGFEPGRSTAHGVLSWWLNDIAAASARLTSVALLPAGVLFAIFAFVHLILVRLTFATLRSLYTSDSRPAPVRVS